MPTSYWSTDNNDDITFSNSGSYTTSLSSIEVTCNLLAGATYEVIAQSAYVKSSVSNGEVDFIVSVNGDTSAGGDKNKKSYNTADTTISRTVIFNYKPTEDGDVTFTIGAICKVACTVTMFTPNIYVKRVA